MSTVSAPEHATVDRRFMEGSHALVEAGLAAGCQFFAGYPMTPFTEILEHYAERLPGTGGVCINAESEIEAVNMAWGAAATGARAATGSTGQGLALMQEAFAEMSNAELPLVIHNMSRGQSDYFQATRGGGHGDYRHIVLSPMDVQEGVELTRLAFDLADDWRTPVLIYGDYFLAHTWTTVELPTPDPGGSRTAGPSKDWAVDGSLGGTGRAKLLTPLGIDKHGRPQPGFQAHFRRIAGKAEAMAREEVRVEVGGDPEPEVVVVAHGSVARFTRFVIEQMVAEGHRIGYVRPITLWPFPTEAVARAAAAATTVAVIENSAGQLVDDVRLAVLGAAPVVFLGEISQDDSNFGVGDLYDVERIRAKIESVVEST